MTAEFTPRRNYHSKGSKPSCILKDTKEMLINSKSYTRFLNDYRTKIQIPTFKTPTITLYPLFRDKSHISLVLKQYQTSDIRYAHTKTPFPSISQKDRLKNKTERRMRIRNRSTLDLFHSVKSFRDHLLCELIPKYKFSLLLYDESLIFHNRKKYNKIIYEKLMLAKEKTIENYTIEKKYVFNENSANEIILTINSMKIEFINITEKKKKPLNLDIPFAYLFLFYYKGIDYFKDLLLSLIRFTNNEFDGIEFIDGDIPDIIKHSKEDFIKLLNPIDESNLFSTKPNPNASRYTQPSKGKISMSNFPSPFVKKELERKSSSYYSKLNAKPHYQIYSFIWNTPKYAYNVNIKLPVINVILPHLKKVIMKEFEDDLFLYILEKNFLDWDFYVISYLFSMKSFRLIMESTLSKRNQIKTLSEFSKKLNRDFEKINISINKIKTYSYLDDSAIFFYTNENNENYIHTLHSFSIKVDYGNLNPNKCFLFEFNFNQMKLLNKISQYESLERFIKKIVITEFDKGEINIDYSMFDNFNENYFDGKTFRSEGELGTVKAPDISVLVSETTSREKSEKMKREMKIKIERPWLEKTEINKLKFIINDEEKRFIPSDLLFEISLKNIIEWPKTLLENSSRITTREFSKKKGYDRKSTSKNVKSGLARSPTIKTRTSRLTDKTIVFSLLKIN